MIIPLDSTTILYCAVFRTFTPSVCNYCYFGGRTFFVLTPGILLLLYPLRLFERFLNLFPIPWHILHTFVDSYQGCYKDGTEPGTRDCRGFASLFFVFFICIYAFSRDSTFYALSTIATYNTGCSAVCKATPN